MNKEVSFPLAKLLTEKGVNITCSKCYAEKKVIDAKTGGDIFTGEYKLSNTSRFIKRYYSAPTIAEVVMWLYEKHGIWISVYSDKSLNWESLFSIKIDWIYPKDSPDAEDNNPKYFKYKGENEFISPTEAYEAAILYTLNNLI